MSIVILQQISLLISEVELTVPPAALSDWLHITSSPSICYLGY